VFTTDPKSHDATVKAYLVKAKGVLLEVTFYEATASHRRTNSSRF
jgi:hypothetical protein